MSSEYTKSILKMVVAQINQTIGWNSIQSTPLEILVSLLQRYLQEVAKLTHRYAEQFGHTDPNLDDLGLAFLDMGINVNELEEYVRNVDSVPFTHEIPMYPLPKESHLNQLKPGSREVVTRPVHVDEHLPPMYPEMEVEEYVPKQTPDVNNSGAGSPQSSPKPVFKRPGDPAPIECPALKRARIMEEEGRPMREISSVMMTTSGFLSPAREGKLPESRTPLPASHSRSNSTEPSSYPMVPPELKGEKKLKKNALKTGVDKLTNSDKKKDQKMKDKFNKKKLLGAREFSKLKALKGINDMNIKNKNSSGKISPNKFQTSPKSNKVIKLDKPETPPPVQPIHPVNTPEEKEALSFDGKLSAEPDKQKLNIFKKISKAKEDKTSTETSENIRGSRESTPGLIIDETDIKKEKRIAGISKSIESVIQMSITESEIKQECSQWTPSNTQESSCNANTSPKNDNILSLSYDDMSPPGTPARPRTPELALPQTPILTEPKRKHKNKSKYKKEGKNRIKVHSPKKIKNKQLQPQPEENINDRPKTPEGVISPSEMVQSNPVFPFFQFPLGLIPPPIGNPLFSQLTGLPIKSMPHPAMPNMPMAPPMFMHSNHPPPILPQPETSPKPGEQFQMKEEIIEPPTSPSVGKVEKIPIVPNLLSTSPKEKCEKEKKSKEHKKEKKEKDKSKKKRDKKDKMKNKDKLEKKKIKLEKKEKIKLKEIKKEKKEKKKEKEREEKAEQSVPKITFRLGPASPKPISPPEPVKKIVIKPIVKKVEPLDRSTTALTISTSSPNVESIKRAPSPELARISALVIRPSKPTKNPKPSPEIRGDSAPNLTSHSSAKISAATPNMTSAMAEKDGNKVWICPACKGQDDGSPMIGCDDCDAWYHWVCVGIQVPPDENEDWYCKICIVKKQVNYTDKKKKSRKKKC